MASLTFCMADPRPLGEGIKVGKIRREIEKFEMKIHSNDLKPQNDLHVQDMNKESCAKKDHTNEDPVSSGAVDDDNYPPPPFSFSSSFASSFAFSYLTSTASSCPKEEKVSQGQVKQGAEVPVHAEDSTLVATIREITAGKGQDPLEVCSKLGHRPDVREFQPQSLEKFVSTSNASFHGDVSRRGDSAASPVNSQSALSDCDSEVDLLRRMVKKFTHSGSEAGDDNEEEEEDFTVHYVHHGKKTDTVAASRPELLQQINELQEAVVEMKGSLTEAVTRLSSVVEDSNLRQELNDVKHKCDTNSAEILKLVLSLKTDVTTLKRDLSAISQCQSSIQSSLCLLIEDRRILAEELHKAGVISSLTRSRLENSIGIAEVLESGSRSTSGSHSNDSGVAHLLEKAHQVFSGDDSGPHAIINGQRLSSDQDSLPEQPSLLVPSSVYEYVAGLSNQNSSLVSTNSSNQHNLSNVVAEESVTTVPAHGQNGSCLSSKDDRIFKEASVNAAGLPVLGSKCPPSAIYNTDDLGLVYDSDSSLTIAANKTISLSACLSQEMRMDERHCPPAHTHIHKEGGRSGNIVRVDSDGSDQSREYFPASRRRKLTVQDDPGTGYYHHKHHRHQYKKSDPRDAQRYKVAREILDTEKKYCKTLWTIQDTFAEPLKRAGMLSNKDITTLFPEEVYLLYDKHCLLQHQLRERLASWKWHPLIGDIFVRFTDSRHSEVLRLYTNYVNDFPEVLKTFHKLCRSSAAFTKFVKTCLEKPSCAGLDLGAFLLSPVQRIPRYILLLKQLLKYTDSSHPDYRHINTCLDRLRDFLARLNDAMEHSFRLVNTTLSPTTSYRSEHTTISQINQGRCPRAAKISDSGIITYESCYGTLSGSERSPLDECARSPQRSLSSASPTSSRLRPLHILASRSASLPRSSLSPDSPGSNGPESSPRSRSQSESTTRRLLTAHTHTSPQSTPSHQPRKLVTAHSVTDVTQASALQTRWEDLAASEPSLLDTTPKQDRDCNDNPSMTAAQSVQSMSNGHKLVTWTDSVGSVENRAKKKTSIKSSLKNMFTFKKRHGHPTRPGHEENSYWMGSSRGDGSDSPIPPVNQVMAIVGDFVDEDGNPCSNV